MSTVLSWSGGKDSLMVLKGLLQNDHEVTLLTTITEEGGVSGHGVRREVLEKQASALGLPLHVVTLPRPSPNGVYEREVRGALEQLRAEGATHAAFGDLFLEGHKTYREKLVAPLGLTSMFPLWRRDSGELVREFLAQGFKAVTVCVNGRVLARDFVGRELNEGFLRDLPEGVDLCGENGEFHTLVYGGPLFERGLELDLGEITFDERFYWCEVQVRST